MRRSHLFAALLLLRVSADAQFQWPEVRVDQSTPGTQTKYTHNLNGQEVPVESVIEVVLESTPTVRITERTTTKYDPNGRPGPVEKELIELYKSGGNERSVRTLRKRDSNGNSYVSEISRTTTNVAGDTTATRTETETGSPNGRLKLSKVEEIRLSRPDEFSSTQTTTVFAPDVNGRFKETGKRITEYRKARNGEVTISYTEYAATPDRGFALVKREVRRVRGDHAEVDVYEANAPGKVAQGEPQMVRRQNIDRSKSGGQTIETTTVQAVSADGRLEAPRPAERRVCSGECQ